MQRGGGGREEEEEEEGCNSFFIKKINFNQ